MAFRAPLRDGRSAESKLGGLRQSSLSANPVESYGGGNGGTASSGSAGSNSASSGNAGSNSASSGNTKSGSSAKGMQNGYGYWMEDDEYALHRLWASAALGMVVIVAATTIYLKKNPGS